MQGSNLYVGNLNYAVTTEQLEELFANHGEVKSVKLIEGKGFGFVTITDEASAEKAIAEFNGKEVEGRELKVSEAKPMEERPGLSGLSSFGRRIPKKWSVWRSGLSAVSR